MLGKDILSKLYDYNAWANARILDGAANLSEAQFLEPSNYGHGSLRNTLYHMLRTEWLWRVLCQDHQIQASSLPRKKALATLEQIRVRWQEEERLTRDFLSGLGDEELAGSIAVQRRDGSAESMVMWQMLAQLILHSMQHRSEVAAILTRFGQSPGDLDFTFFVR